MSKHWKEIADPVKHKDYMTSYDHEGVPIEFDGKLSGQVVYFVKVASFTFHFIDLEQIQMAIDFFSKKVHPSRREPNDGHEHYWQKWSSRLPAGLNKDVKRIKVLNALKKAQKEFSENI